MAFASESRNKINMLAAPRSLALVAPLLLLLCTGVSARAPPGSCSTGVEEEAAATGEVMP